jgi:ABC-type polysaccharide/polyol phosphate transport system ATPase subunit
VNIETIQTAIQKGKTVFIKGHNESHPITFFKVHNGIITIEAGNVRRFKIAALDYFLSKAVIL